MSTREANKILYSKRLSEAKELLLKRNIDWYSMNFILLVLPVHLYILFILIENINVCLLLSLIIASKFNPTPLVTTLIEYVAPSRPIVVYSQYQEVKVLF